VTRLTLKRNQALSTAIGTTAGAWSVPQLGLTLWRDREDVWDRGRHGDANGWRIRPTNYWPDRRDNGWREQTGAAREAWLRKHGLHERAFARRKDALAALEVAFDVDRPAFFDPRPCRHCDASGYHQYDDNHQQPCSHCCPHGKGWWQATAAHGPRFAERHVCNEGCGAVREELTGAPDQS